MKKFLLAALLIGFSQVSYSSHLLGGVLYATCNDDPNTVAYEHDLQLTFLMKVGGSSVSIEELTAAQFVAYPNPAADRITLEFEEPMTTFEMIDGAGQVVHQQDIQRTSRSVDVEFSQAPGMYILRMTSAEGVMSHQVIIVK